jgi:tetratricopeptide (TPR) repeat protein
MTDPEFRSELDAAIDLSDDGEWEAALKAFDRLVTAHPGEMQPRFERAMVLLNLNRDLEAIAELEHVLKHAPDYPGAKDWYARAPRDQGKSMLAAEIKLEELLALAPEHWSANGQTWAECARYFLEAGAPERALAALDVYFARYEGKQQGYESYAPAPYRLRAETLLALGRPQEALAAAERACADPHSVPADKFVRIRALAGVGEIDRALGELKHLQQEYEGTRGFAEAMAALKWLGAKID